MEGHWERDGECFDDIDEMWDYIRDNEDWFDEIDFERWLNEHYSAADIVWMSVDDHGELHDLYLEMVERFEDSEWGPDVQIGPVIGKDYCYGPHGEFEFKWVGD